MSAAILVGMVAAWSLFAPLQFGGQASYVLVAGASMEPSLHTGDLVIARLAPAYDVGDVVTYLHPHLGPIIHRIIGIQGESFTLQGDNNDWTDSYHPAQSEILGKSWITLPGAAVWLYRIRTPLGLLLLSLAMGAMVMTTGSRSKPKKVDKADPMRSTARRSEATTLNELKDGWFFVLSFLLLGGLLLGIYAFSCPLQQSLPVEVSYQHRGHFSYQAVGMPSVYDDGRIEAGQAIFHSLVPSFEATFEYQLSTDLPLTASGSYRLTLEVSEPNGWRRSMELIPETSFDGPSFSTTAQIDLRHVLWLVESLKDRTGFNRSVFNVNIVPEIEVAGEIAGREFQDRYAPALEFLLDDYQLYLANSSPAEQVDDPLNPQSLGMITYDRRVPAALSLLGIKIGVAAARWAAGLMVAAALAGGAVILRPTFRVWRQGESQRIHWRYAEYLLEVDKLPRTKSTQTFDVAQFDDLVKLVQPKGGLILHTASADQHTYLVIEDEMAYRFIQKEVSEDRV